MIFLFFPFLTKRIKDLFGVLKISSKIYNFMVIYKVESLLLLFCYIKVEVKSSLKRLSR